MKEKLQEYRLGSRPFIHLPGMMGFWRNGYQTQPELAFWQMAMGFPTLPAALIADVLSGRCSYTLEGDTVVILWGEPKGEFKDYCQVDYSICEEG